MPAFTCSKLTIETLEQDVKYVQSQQQRYQNDTSGVVLVSLLLTTCSLLLTPYFTPCPSVSIVNFEHC